MVRAVIELPEDVHAKLNELAHRRGVSLGDVLREMAERAADIPITQSQGISSASIPPARDLGIPRIPERYWRELASEQGPVVERLAAEGRLDELDQV